MPLVPAFGREPFEHEIKTQVPGMSYDDIYKLNTHNCTQFDGFRHFAHLPSQTFYHGTKEVDIVGHNANLKCSIHHWAEHGMAGRGVFLDYWAYAKAQGTTYDPFDHYVTPYSELVACANAQGIDIRPESQGGDILPGDIALIRSGWKEMYDSKKPEERKIAALREEITGPHDGQRWAGISPEEANVDWIHDCYFAAVGGDSVTFEAWPSLKEGDVSKKFLGFLTGTRLLSPSISSFIFLVA
jgi:putative cyclase